jgi:hypothetical protein
MRKFSRVSRAAALGVGLLCGVPTYAYENSSRLLTYTDRDQTYFALSLATDLVTAPRSDLKVAVLVDTSASQSGAFRSDSIELASRLIQSLSSQTQVALYSCDVEPTLLATGKPGSATLDEGLKKLQATIPLGATDVVSAIRTAKKELAKGSDGKDLSIVYIGDGVHRKNLVKPEGFESFVNELRADRTTVLSLAIGPDLDIEFLATLANHTGGSVYVHCNLVDLSNQQIAEGLAKACAVPVFWPESSSFPKAVASHFPATVPPLRADRDSILVGRLADGQAAGDVVLKGSWGAKKSELVWTVKTEAENPDLEFLSEVVDRAQVNKGLLLPTAGSDALRAFGLTLVNSSDELLRDARYALSIGDRQGAITIAKEALKRAPSNVAAKAVLEAASKSEVPVAAPRDNKPRNVDKHNSQVRRQALVRFISTQVGGNPFGDEPQPPITEPEVGTNNPFGDDDTIPPPAQPAPAVGSGAPMNPASSFDDFSAAGQFLRNVEDERKAAGQALEVDVANAVRQAQSDALARRDLGIRKLSLKSLLDQVRRTPNLDAGSRLRLERKLEDAIQRTQGAEMRQAEELASQEAVRASQAATQRLLAEEERRQETIKQLVDRYDSLMRQQLYGAANNEVAPQVREIAPGTIIQTVTELESNVAANAQLVMDVVHQRRRAFVDSLYLNEQALVPFVDEPPVRYPPADVWRALSARRLLRYGSIDLSGGNESERRIYSSLDRKVEAQDIPGLPFSQVIKRFAAELDIPIIIDDRALADASIQTEEPVTLDVPSISFRSVLKLILNPLELTYVIEDEVMKITTKDE